MGPLAVLRGGGTSSLPNTLLQTTTIPFVNIKNVIHLIFFQRGRLCYSKQVFCVATIRRLLSGFAILGLILVPLARPAMAVDSHSAQSVHALEGQAHSTAHSAETAMPEGMPCCPDEAPIPDCGEHCPLMALCMSQFLQGAPMWAGPLVRLSLSSVVVPGNDRKLTGHVHGPPPRPPKAAI